MTTRARFCCCGTKTGPGCDSLNYCNCTKPMVEAICAQLRYNVPPGGDPSIWDCFSGILGFPADSAYPRHWTLWNVPATDCSMSWAGSPCGCTYSPNFSPCPIVSVACGGSPDGSSSTWTVFWHCPGGNIAIPFLTEGLTFDCSRGAPEGTVVLPFPSEFVGSQEGYTIDLTLALGRCGGDCEPSLPCQSCIGCGGNADCSAIRLAVDATPIADSVGTCGGSGCTGNVFDLAGDGISCSWSGSDSCLSATIIFDAEKLCYVLTIKSADGMRIVWQGCKGGNDAGGDYALDCSNCCGANCNVPTINVTIIECASCTSCAGTCNAASRTIAFDLGALIDCGGSECHSASGAPVTLIQSSGCNWHINDGCFDVSVTFDATSGCYILTVKSADLSRLIWQGCKGDGNPFGTYTLKCGQCCGTNCAVPTISTIPTTNTNCIDCGAGCATAAPDCSLTSVTVETAGILDDPDACFGSGCSAAASYVLTGGSDGHGGCIYGGGDSCVSITLSKSSASGACWVLTITDPQGEFAFWSGCKGEASPLGLYTLDCSNCCGVDCGIQTIEAF